LQANEVLAAVVEEQPFDWRRGKEGGGRTGERKGE